MVLINKPEWLKFSNDVRAYWRLYSTRQTANIGDYWWETSVCVWANGTAQGSEHYDFTYHYLVCSNLLNLWLHLMKRMIVRIIWRLMRKTSCTSCYAIHAMHNRSALCLIFLILFVKKCWGSALKMAKTKCISHHFEPATSDGVMRSNTRKSNKIMCWSTVDPYYQHINLSLISGIFPNALSLKLSHITLLEKPSLLKDAYKLLDQFQI